MSGVLRQMSGAAGAPLLYRLQRRRDRLMLPDLLDSVVPGQHDILVRFVPRHVALDPEPASPMTPAADLLRLRQRSTASNGPPDI